jgi:L-fuconolactonase
MIIDAHQHVWDRGRARYDWLTDDLAAINRDFGFDELRPELDAAGVSGTVLVQAADNPEDTDLMLEVAAREPRVLGVVAYAPLEDAAGTADALARYRDLPIVCGIRTLIHDQPDPGWLLRPDVMAGLGMLEAGGMTLDVVAVLPQHLEAAIEVGKRFPGLTLVIDHLGHPSFGGPGQDRWRDLIAAAGENPRASAKVSGLYPDAAADPAGAAERIRPSFEHALAVFGADRLMYGGDWPVSVLHGGYAAIWASVRMLLDPLSDGDRQAILHRTAARVYRLRLSATP